jgi:hypothetical protein
VQVLREANVNCADDYEKNSPLIIAVFDENKDMLKYLIINKAD